MRSIELFAGAGGLAIATANAGFNHEAVLEWDQNACDTIRRNKAAGLSHVRNWQVVQGDVCAYDFNQHAGRVEFVSGGPPCQPFSIGGKHKGMFDQRNMFPHAVRAVREIAPKAFLFENVKGFLRKSFANYYNYILQQLIYPEIVSKGDEEWTDHHARLEKAITGGKNKGLKYNVVFQLLNAADFGVPQRRERVLIVGVRSDLGINFGFPKVTHEEDALVYEKWVSGDYWERHKIAKCNRPKMPERLRSRVGRLACLWPKAMLKPWRTVRDTICDLPQISPGERCSEFPNHFYNPGARSYAGHNGSPLDEPAKTLKAGDHGVPGGENMVRLQDGSVRYFSVRECARLQTFPDDWVFEGSWTESMRQLGNAVPVSMAQVVANEIHKMVRLADHVIEVIRGGRVLGNGHQLRR
ncbi:MAG TPA: DNA cytosine methyltransferase [Fimbriiglobus sp.]|jgi:DNA (cytosine-5)-methyltransferase 1